MRCAGHRLDRGRRRQTRRSAAQRHAFSATQLSREGTTDPAEHLFRQVLAGFAHARQQENAMACGVHEFRFYIFLFEREGILLIAKNEGYCMLYEER